MRNGRIWFWVLIGLILFGLVAGAVSYAYNVGLAEGIVAGATVATPPVEGGVVPVPPATVPFRYYQSFGFQHPFGFGFGFLGCLIPIFFILLLFALFRFAFRPHWGGGWRRGGWDAPEGDIPPRVQEWHRKMHEQEPISSPPPAGQPG